MIYNFFSLKYQLVHIILALELLDYRLLWYIVSKHQNQLDPDEPQLNLADTVML
jgi:hypothetical protein